MGKEKVISVESLFALLENNAIRSISNIIPHNDLIEHISSPDCQCKPDLILTDGVHCLVKHLAIDGRVAIENANEILGLETKGEKWSSDITIIPELCMCEECQEMREEGPDMVFIHSLINTIFNKHILVEDEDFAIIEELKSYCNSFTGLDNLKK